MLKPRLEAQKVSTRATPSAAGVRDWQVNVTGTRKVWLKFLPRPHATRAKACHAGRRDTQGRAPGTWHRIVLFSIKPTPTQFLMYQNTWVMSLLKTTLAVL